MATQDTRDTATMLLNALGIGLTPEQKSRLNTMKGEFPVYTGPMSEDLTPGGPVVQGVVPSATKAARKAAVSQAAPKAGSQLELLWKRMQAQPSQTDPGQRFFKFKDRPDLGEVDVQRPVRTKNWGSMNVDIGDPKKVENRANTLGAKSVMEAVRDLFSYFDVGPGTEIAGMRTTGARAKPGVASIVPRTNISESERMRRASSVLKELHQRITEK